MLLWEPRWGGPEAPSLTRPMLTDRGQWWWCWRGACLQIGMDEAVIHGAQYPTDWPKQL